MFKVALKGVMARKGRILLTSIAIIAGTAFLAGVFVLTDTIQKSFDTLFADAYAKTDAWVRSSNVIEGDFGAEQRERIPDTIVADVAAVPGVKQANADIMGVARITAPDGKDVGRDNGPPKFGGVFDAKDETSPWTLIDGKAAAGPDQVVIDKNTAKSGDIKVGDKVKIASTGLSREFEVTGIVRFGDADTSGGATWALFDLPTAQEFVAQPGVIDAVSVRGDGSVSDAELSRRIEDTLKPSHEIETLTGEEITKENQSDIQDSLKFLTIFFSIFAGISIFVGSFVIYNVFSISAAQRQRENALMRAIGASRRQVTTAMLVEAVAVGLVGAILGFFGGVALALGVSRLLKAIGLPLGNTGLVIKPSTLIITVIVGVLVTVVCALAPALRAGRVPPLAAMRDVAIDRSSVSRARVVIGTIATVIAIISIVLGLSGGSALWLAPGIIGAFVAIIVFGPLLAAPFARLANRPLRRVRGITGEMASQNAARSPKRTALTAAALMVGVSLLIGISVIASSARKSIEDVFSRQFTGDYTVTSNGGNGLGDLSPQLVDKINDLPEVGDAAAVGIQPILINGDAKSVTVVDPTTIGALFDPNFLEGQLSDLTKEGVMVSKDKADRDDLKVGSTLKAQLFGPPFTLTVQGIYDDKDLAGNLMVNRHLFDDSNTDRFDFGIFITRAPGVSDADAQKAIEQTVTTSGSGKFQTKAEYIKSQTKQIDPFLNIIYGLLTISVFIAALGIIITLLLAVYERRRELGLVRAVGMTRPQVRSSIRWEAVITAIFGALEGVVIGMLLGWVMVKALRDQGFTVFQVPWTALIIIIVLALVVGVVAAWIPARRAAKANILEAIATT